MSATPSASGKFTVLFSVAAVLFSVAFLIMGHGLQQMLLPIRAGGEGFSANEIGLLGSGYFVGFVLGCYYAPRIIVSAGHVRTFAALVAVASAAALGHPIHVDPILWIALRLVTGFCLAGLYLVVESWINERATNESRGFLMSFYVGLNFTVITIGQMMITVIDPSSFALFSLASILVSLAAVPIVLTRSPQPAPVTLVRFRPRHLYKISPAGVVGIFCIGLANGAFWSLGAVFAEQTTSSITTAAIFMSLAVIGGATLQWPMGVVSDKIDRRFVMMALATASAISGLALVFYGKLDAVGLAIGFVFGASLLPSYAISAAHTFDYADRGDTVEVSASLLLLNGLGSAIGPLLAANTMVVAGPSGLLIYNAAIQAILVLFICWRLTIRSSPNVEEKSEFDLGTAGPIVGVADTESLTESDLVVVREEETDDVVSWTDEGTTEVGSSERKV